MRKHYDPLFEETWYTDTCDNGMEIVLFHKKDFSLTCCALGVPYGAYDLYERYKGEDVDFHPGVAHFLEHKLFESKEEDLMAAFSLCGANVNAFTSYKETVYHFSTNSSDIYKPLGMLLGMVEGLDISEESVEKEKGIISQEVGMYAEMADTRLLNETMKSLYERNPLRYDIGGDRESIAKITKDELMTCYRINYMPSNRTLCITTPCDPEEVISFIKEEESKRGRKREELPQKRKIEEKEGPDRPTFTFDMAVNKNKHVFAVKLRPDFKNTYDAFYKEWCMRICLEAHLSGSNPLYQIWIDRGWINDYFGYEIEFDEEYAHILFFIESEDETVLERILKEAFEEDRLSEEVLQRLKRRYIGSAYDSLDDPESFTLGYIRDALSGMDFFKCTKLLGKISAEDIRDTVSSFN